MPVLRHGKTKHLRRKSPWTASRFCSCVWCEFCCMSGVSGGFPMTTIDQYREMVMDRIRVRLGGKPKFVPDEFWINHSFQRNHDPDIAARVAIEDAIRAE